MREEGFSFKNHNSSKNVAITIKFKITFFLIQGDCQLGGLQEVLSPILPNIMCYVNSWVSIVGNPEITFIFI